VEPDAQRPGLSGIGRLSLITLGVADLARASAFYRGVFGLDPNPDNSGVAFFELPGTWLALYPRDKLAEDIGIPDTSAAFSGITLAFNGRDKAEVDAVYARALAAGGEATRAPRETFWGGYSGYFADLDGYYWEVAWGPMFDLAPDGALRFRRS